MHSIEKDTIYTNVALTEDGDIWWEGIGYDAPGKLIDWKGNEWNAATAEVPAAHPNARFTAKASNCPAIASEWEDPAGVPISAFLFGGRRPSTIPLINQAASWNHGVFMGSVVGSEVTAAALDLKAGTVRRDPFAMLPFCAYNMGDYFQHWVNLGEQADQDKLPKIFYVNWFRKSDDGRWLWPGFGDNSRVLKWIFERCDNAVEAVETPIGFMPKTDDIDISGLEGEVSKADLEDLLAVDIEGWKSEIAQIKEHYARFGDKLPKALSAELEALEARLNG
jgi:phosphoenolpyruvate carboxykinase (GTP)